MSKVEIIKSKTGYSIYINDYRIAGEKPLDGSVVFSQDVKKKEIVTGLKNENQE